MTTQSLQSSLEHWLARLSSNIRARMDFLPRPPAMLDHRMLIDNQPSDGYGFALELSEGERHVWVWLPVAGLCGAYCAFTEGDDEIISHHLPAYTDESSALSLLETGLSEHLLANTFL